VGRRPTNLELLLALLGTDRDHGLDGTTVTNRVAPGGRELAASKVLAQLLALEASGHVHVDRGNGYRFSLTRLGEDAAYELGPGDPIEVVLVMVDLVGFVSFTAEHGDSAAHRAAVHLQDVGDAELRRVGGALVKPLGDGFLGSVRSTVDAIDTVQNVAHRCRRPDGEPWAMRAAVHRGRPIAFRGDLYGADVNLTARLCEAARPGELVMSAGQDAANADLLDVRGLRDPIAVTRMNVP
jgi:class 3 adenylate cyclase